MANRRQVVDMLVGYTAILAMMAVLALVIGTCAVWLLNHGLKPSSGAIRKWVGMTGMTLTLFGFAIKQSRRFWRSKVFWATIGTLLIIHTGAFVVVFRGVEQWRVAWFFFISTLEIVPIFAVLDWSMVRFGNRPQTKAACDPHRM